MPLAPGTRLGPYEILAPLGAGGMGEVFRARDERLRRDVALKLLPENSFADETARNRLLHEARSAAKLNHPNICTIHDVGQADNHLYVAMELVPGKPLDAASNQEQFTTDSICRIGAQIADALEHAHQHGIVHRDLKCANIVLTPQGHPKILDFGLATRTAGSASDLTRSRSLTEASQDVAGTLSYMAPEILRGQPADERSDIWALGVVLFRMATGNCPFRGATNFEITSAILRDTPALPQSAPPGLAAVIRRCLEKNPAQRYAHAGEVRSALETLTTQPVPSSPEASGGVRADPRVKSPRRAMTLGLAAIVSLAVVAGVFVFDIGGLRSRLARPSASSQIQSLAVIPLENLSRDPEQEFFADGMTEALIAELSKIGALKVTSRTSVMQYKGVKKPLPEIARALKVEGIVEGSVMREGGRVRITVQLIRADTDTHLWAESYDREVRGILALQGEVARAIAREIRVTLTPEEESSFASKRDVDPEAHALTLRGRFLINQENTSKEALETSIGLFRQALERDPAYAPGYAGLAIAYNTLAGVGYLPMQQGTSQAKTAAQRAIELDPSLGEAYAARAAARSFGEWDWAGGEEDFRRAIALSPSAAYAHDTYAFFLSALQRHEEALAHSKRAQELDPLSPVIGVHLAQYYRQAGQIDEAVKECDKVLALYPEQVFAKWMKAVVLSEQKKYDEAIALFLSRKVSTAATNWSLAYTYGRAGRKREAQRIIDFLIARRKERYLWPGIIAIAYAGKGEKDRAFEWLAKGIEERDYWAFMLQVDPRWDSLRGDPRFQEMLRRVNFPK